jgi:NTE family protein
MKNTYDTYEYTNLVLEGSAAKIYAFCGALEVLEERGCLKNINNIAGTSSGSILAFLLAIGYNSNEIKEIVFNTDFKKLTSCNWFQMLKNIFRDWGLYSTKGLEDMMSDLLFKKIGQNDITFEELYKKHNKILVVTGTCLNQRRTHYYHYQSNPQMSIIKAVSISIRIPFVFPSYKWRGDVLVDGCLLDNYPLWFFDNESTKLPNSKTEDPKYNPTKHSISKKTLGIKLLQEGEKPVPDLWVNDSIIKDIKSYSLEIINTMMTHIEREDIRPNFWEQTVVIQNSIFIPNTSLFLDEETKKQLIEIGQNSAHKFLEQKIENNKNTSNEKQD